MTEGKSEHSHNYIDCPPEFVTDAADIDIINELMQREPIFTILNSVERAKISIA